MEPKSLIKPSVTAFVCSMINCSLLCNGENNVKRFLPPPEVSLCRTSFSASLIITVMTALKEIGLSLLSISCACLMVSFSFSHKIFITLASKEPKKRQIPTSFKLIFLTIIIVIFLSISHFISFYHNFLGEELLFLPFTFSRNKKRSKRAY